MQKTPHAQASFCPWLALLPSFLHPPHVTETKKGRKGKDSRKMRITQAWLVLLEPRQQVCLENLNPISVLLMEPNDIGERREMYANIK